MTTTPTPPDRQDADRDKAPTRGYAFVTGGAYALLFLLGAVLGVLGAFCQAWRIVGGFPLVALLAVAASFAVCWGAGHATQTRAGAAVVAAGWLLAVFLLAAGRPEGDVVIASSAAGYVYLFGGALALAVATALTPPAGTGGFQPRR